MRCGAFTTHTIDVVATADIYKGTPITISYVNPKLKWMQRCTILSENYGFICACSLCAAEYNKTPATDLEGDAAAEAAAVDEESDSGSSCEITEGWGEVEDALA